MTTISEKHRISNYCYLFLFLVLTALLARLTHPVYELQSYLEEHPALSQFHIDDLLFGIFLGSALLLCVTFCQLRKRYSVATESAEVKHQHYELLSNLPIAIAELDNQKLIEICNKNFTDLLGSVGEGELAQVIKTLTTQVSRHKPNAVYSRDHDLHQHGEKISISWMAFLQENGNYLLLGIHRNHVNNLAQEISISRKILEQTPIGVLVADKKMRIEYTNQAFERVTGYSQQEVLGKNPSILQSGKHSQEFYRSLHGTLKQSGIWQGEIWNKRKNGETYLEWLSITALRDEAGEPTHYIGMFSEITAQEHVRQKLHNLAYFDSLTSLANRSYLEELLLERIGIRNDKILCLLFIDMDGFKRINDSLGHEIGDELLIAFSKRLKHNVRGDDIVARWGGDEFIVGFSSTKPAIDIQNICNKLLHEMCKPYWIKGKELNITVSIGAYSSPKETATVEELIRNSDTAMYLAKRKGKCRFEVFSPELHQELTENIEIEGRLRNAIKQGSLDVAFQPQIVTDGVFKIKGIEALARWHDDLLGTVPPNKFLVVAESTGLMNELGKVVIRKAFEKFQKYRPSTNVQLSVNLSATQLIGPDIVEFLISEASLNALPTHTISLEITEDIFIEDMHTALKKLRTLKEAGFKISLDDFGTGYSSLAYLKDFEIDELKIDRSFVIGIEHSMKNQGIIKAIISMTDFMGINCVVEGIETDEQLQILLDLGCKHFQGYLFAKPLPPQELKHFSITYSAESLQL